MCLDDSFGFQTLVWRNALTCLCFSRVLFITSVSKMMVLKGCLFHLPNKERWLHSKKGALEDHLTTKDVSEECWTLGFIKISFEPQKPNVRT